MSKNLHRYKFGRGDQWRVCSQRLSVTPGIGCIRHVRCTLQVRSNETPNGYRKLITYRCDIYRKNRVAHVFWCNKRAYTIRIDYQYDDRESKYGLGTILAET
jgi:hypothetical protein